MNRCSVCNSTEIKDTLADDGLPVDTITKWTIDENNDLLCNRCYESIRETYAELCIDDIIEE